MQMPDERRKQIVDRVALNRLARSSLVFFREIFFPDPRDVEPAAFHHQWSDILLNGQKHFAIEAFRESAKTQIVIRANLLHAIAYPSPRRSYIAMICANKGLAENRLKEISRLLKDKSNPMLSVTIDDIIADSGNALEVKIKPGCGSGVNSVRIETYGKGSAVRGLVWGSKRPDLVIIDDPQDVEDARSETVTVTDWDWFLSDIIFLGQQTRIFLIGNNLGERCIIERVIDQAQHLGFESRRIPVLDEDGNSSWPARFSKETMEAERDNYARLGKIDLWYRERMCRCISPDSQMFKREDFKYYNPQELDLFGMSVYMTIDPAASEAESADRTAICVVAVNDNSQWFVLELWAERKKPSDVMDAIFRLVRKWRPLVVGIEMVAYQAALEDFLVKEMPRRNIFFTIEKLRAAKKKELRIETALQPRFKAGVVWFPELTPWVSEIEQELLNFPHGLHDDTIDALAYIDQIAGPVTAPGRIDEPRELFYDFE